MKLQKMENSNDVDFEINIGICAMAKKVKSKPMLEILKRLKKYKMFRFVIFEENLILNDPVESWPIVDCFIAFYSTGFPLHKAISYADLRKPLVLNDLKEQDALQDRREVYETLQKNGIQTPRHVIFNRDKNNIPLNNEKEIEENDDVIIVKGHVFHKPFVEKPIDAEDHNVYIYYPSSAGGGCQILFRKVGDTSSVYSSKSTIRRQGSYIYEDFMPTDGTDVKVYTIGEYYAHAEARKAPVLDGKVERDQSGKELRYPVILNQEEKLIAQKVSQSFKQTVCGFDLLRANGKSFVCDVNGFSFVKTSKKYYDDCSQLLANIILKNLAPNFTPHLSNSPVTPEEDMAFNVHEKRYRLRSVVSIMRHGDRTPKQKMKLIVTHKLFFDFFHKNGGEKDGRLKIKKPKRMQEILDIVRTLVEGYDSNEDIQPIEESKSKLMQMKSVLEMYGTFHGINRKVQIKSMNDKRNASMLTKLKGRNTRVSSDSKSLLVIVKWGGELTPFGKNQAEELGRAFRCVYSGWEDDNGLLQGSGMLRLHSSNKHDLKIYASDEGRVQMTAAAFAKGLLELEGELTPILVSLVKSNNYSTGMLDTPAEVDESMSKVKSQLHDLLRIERKLNEEEIKELSPIEDSSIRKALELIGNPNEMCAKVYALIDDLEKQIALKCEENSNGKIYYDESLTLMDHRWKKLKKDFFNGTEYDISLIPDIYDCVRYDFIHNARLQLNNLEELYNIVKPLADIVIPQEYGMSEEVKLKIAKKIAGRFFKKLQVDLQSNIHYDNNSNNAVSENIRTRLYITSESHIHSVVNALKCGSLKDKVHDKDWEKALTYLNNTSELNYLTQILFIEYEDMEAPIESDDRYQVSLYFSPGVRAPATPELLEHLQELSSGNSSDFIFKSPCDLDDVQEAAETKVKSMAGDRAIHKKFNSFNTIEENGVLETEYANSTGSNFLAIPKHRMRAKLCEQTMRESIEYQPTILSLKMHDNPNHVNIHEAEIIETIPSLHPLVLLHKSVTLTAMDEFLNEMRETDDKR